MLLLFKKGKAKEKHSNLPKRALLFLGALVCCAACAYFLLLQPDAVTSMVSTSSGGEEEESRKEDYIHWVDFNVPLEVLEQALKYDLKSHNEESGVKLCWIELLAYTAAKNGGVFKESKRSADMDKLVERLQAGERLEEITDGMRYYAYYTEAYTAVLGGFVGEYDVAAEGGGTKMQYGLKVYSPIAREFGFGHYDDFGNPRTYGYKRLHLGNDLLGAVGAPIIAVEGGVVQALGWNQYGGWRVGIRSHDGFRYYYYAHMRKDYPYVKTLQQGDIVKAGDVIGYMGMTGYSTKENVNNIKVPHLHFGLQLIFDESQVDGVNQIWIDVYNIVRLLERNRMPVKKVETGEYMRADGLMQGVSQE